MDSLGFLPWSLGAIAPRQDFCGQHEWFNAQRTDVITPGTLWCGEKKKKKRALISLGEKSSLQGVSVTTELSLPSPPSS